MNFKVSKMCLGIGTWTVFSSTLALTAYAASLQCRQE